MLVLASLLVTLGAAAELNYFEWSAVAPVVLTGDEIGMVGRFLQIRVGEVLRGDDVRPGDVVQLSLRRTNRTRNLNVDPKPFKPVPEVRYIWLLQKESIQPPQGPPLYRLVRGVRSARELPAEGQEAVLAALRRFVQIQDMKSDAPIWAAFEAMLEESSPILLTTALEQHVKFRRGAPELLLSVRPLLDHPVAGIRELTASLIGQILARHPGGGIPEEGALLSELVARARRDPSIGVRVAATAALDGLRDDAVNKILQEIADEDPEQLVRYTAERVLLERRESEPAHGGGP